MVTQEVLDLLAKQDRKLYAAVLKDFQSISEVLNSSEIEEMLAVGLEEEVLQLIRDAVKKETSEFPTVLTASFMTLGLYFASTLKVKATFDILNPSIFNVYAPYKQALLDSLNKEIVETASLVLFSTRWQQITGQERVDLLKRTIGLSKNQWLAVENYRKQLESKSLDALKRGLRDKEKDTMIRTAFKENGLSKKQIDILVGRYIETYKKLRADSIATTEATRAYSLAQNTLLQQMVDDGDIQESEIKRFWNTMKDEKVRKHHRSIPSMNKEGRGFKEAFATPLGNLLFPGDPAGTPSNVYNCRCFLTFKLSEAE